MTRPDDGTDDTDDTDGPSDGDDADESRDRYRASGADGPGDGGDAPDRDAWSGADGPSDGSDASAPDGTIDACDGTIDACDGTTERLLRARALLAEYRLYLAVGLVLVVVLGGWLTYGAYVDPPRETEQRVTDAWTMTGEFDHEAEITGESTVYETGRVVSGEPLYYTALSPSATGAFTVAYDSTAGQDVTVSVSPELVYRSTDGETTYWEQRRPLDGATESGVIPGERVTARFDVDVADLQQRIDEIESELGASPGETEAFVTVAVELDGRIDGQRRSIAERYRIPLALDGETYAFDAADPYEERFEETETVTTVSSPSATRAVGGPLLVLVGLAGLAGLAVLTRRFGTPTAAEREWLDYREDRSAFGELVTVSTLPADVRARPRAPVPSFEQLARLAIDLDAPLFADRAEGRYLVPHGDVIYEFDPPAIDAGDAGTTAELPVPDPGGRDDVVVFDDEHGRTGADQRSRRPGEESDRLDGAGPGQGETGRDDRPPAAREDSHDRIETEDLAGSQAGDRGAVARDRADDARDRAVGTEDLSDDADERAASVDAPPRSDDA